MSGAGHSSSLAPKNYVELQADDADVLRRLTTAEGRAGVAILLEISDRFLCSVLYGREERGRYQVFEIPKKTGGTRVINAPPKNLSILQQKVRYAISLLYKAKQCVHGFVPGRSIATNAAIHVGQRYVLNVDLLDFFPSIKIGRVIGALRSEPFNIEKRAATVLAQIACTATGELPQGSSCSPVLANVVSHGLDVTLLDLASRYHCKYTRFADDISISTSKPSFPSMLAEFEDGRWVLGDALAKAISDAGFVENPGKVKLQSWKRRQEVTGLCVNEFSNVDRRHLRELGATIRVWEKLGEAQAQKVLNQKLFPHVAGSDVSIVNYCRGKIGFIQMVRGEDDPIVRRAKKRLSDVCPDAFKSIKPLAQVNPTPLRSVPRNVSGWNSVYGRVASSVYQLKVKTKDYGDQTGSAFRIGRSLLGTAGHNLQHLEIAIVLPNGDEVPVQKHKYRCALHDTDVGLLKLPANVEVAGDPIPSQGRLPELGEEVAAIGYPAVAWRQTTVSLRSGVVEALPTTQNDEWRFISVGFVSAGGLSGAPLIDKRGFVVGIVVENTLARSASVGMQKGRASEADEEVTRSDLFGQASPIEYLTDLQYGRIDETTPCA